MQQSILTYGKEVWKEVQRSKKHTAYCRLLLHRWTSGNKAIVFRVDHIRNETIGERVGKPSNVWDETG